MSFPQKIFTQTSKQIFTQPSKQIFTRANKYLHNQTNKYSYKRANKQTFIQTSKQTNSPDGKCTFGSGQNQMTMTYISFTGWLRSLHCDVIMDHGSILTGIESCFESWIHFDWHVKQVLNHGSNFDCACEPGTLAGSVQVYLLLLRAWSEHPGSFR